MPKKFYEIKTLYNKLVRFSLKSQVERQLIEAATHRSGNSSKWQLIEHP
jgi:hypothetical protein